MSNASGTIEIIAGELSKLLQPLKDDLTPSRTKQFLAELGFGVNDGQAGTLAVPLRATAEHTVALVGSTRELINAIKDENVNEIVSKGLEIVGTARSIIESFDGIKNGISGLGLPGVTPAVIGQVPERLLNYLLIRYTERFQGVTPVLSFLGIIEQTEQNVGSVDPAAPPFTLSKFNFNKLADWLTHPDQQLLSLYGWGDSSFDGRSLFIKLEDILSRQGLPVLLDETGPLPKLDLVFVEGVPRTDINPKGVAFRLKNAWNTDFTLSGDDHEMNFKLEFTPPVNTELVIQPNGHVQFTPPSPSPMSGSALFDLKIEHKTNPRPYTILGQPGGSRLEIMKFNLRSGAGMQEQAGAAKGSFFIEGTINGGKVVIDPSGGDGFLSKILPSTKFEGGFDITFGVSSETGVYFTGSSTLEIRLPMHLAIGPITLEGLTLQLGFKDGKFPISIGTDVKGELGPMTVVVENIGMRAVISFPPGNSGNLGPVDLALGFKPPNGLGISINAGAVIGGGYLSFDFEKEEYAGALELTIAGFISAKAIGLITTKMPDGSKGFSMLIIITAEFNPGFQLGYGFTLLGVGGLLGLNRTMLLDPLRNAVRTGAVNSIMFPQNVIANAPRIISDLKAIFPPYEGKFLIGPMGKIGWGTPTLVSVSLGLIIEIPGNIAILGKLAITLPDERVPLLRIQVLFVGTLDFEKKMLTFDASLFESFVLTMTLEGDMALRLKWGDEPNFLMTAGGFHPSFTPPPLSLPTLRRMAINILNTDIAKIRVECYQAVTSNTVQFGSRAEVLFDLSACSIEGHITFDALFQFNPFYFIIEISAGFKLEAAGIDVMTVRVRMTLEGPTPWRARGTGSVSLLFFEISADFDVTWGDSANTSIPDIAVFEKLVIELKKKEQWSTVLSTNKNLLVSLRKFKETANPPLVLHPAGSLVVQQKLMPLTVKIDKIGNQKVTDIQKAVITEAISGGSLLNIVDVNDDFARAQYQNLSDADKLSKPSFEKLPGGVNISLGGINIKNGKMLRRKVEYEVTIIDKEPQKPLPKGMRFALGGILFDHFLRGNSASKSPLSKNQKDKLNPFDEKIDVGQEGYAVAFQSNNKAYTTEAVFASEMAAQTFMHEQITKNPSLKKEIHIIPNYELHTV